MKKDKGEGNKKRKKKRKKEGEGLGGREAEVEWKEGGRRVAQVAEAKNLSEKVEEAGCGFGVEVSLFRLES